VFTVRYALSPYIKQAIFAFKVLNLIFISLTTCHVFKVKFGYICSFLFLAMEFLEIQVVSKVLRWFETSVNFSKPRVISQKSIVSSSAVRVSAFVVFRCRLCC